jgi:hypothetical protein
MLTFSVCQTLLSVLAIRSDSTMNRFQDLQKLTRNAFNYLYKFIMNMRKGEATVQLHKTLSAIVKFAPADASLTDRVQKAAVTILRKDWRDNKEMKVCLRNVNRRRRHTLFSCFY